jgi:Rieske Fe-S protein
MHRRAFLGWLVAGVNGLIALVLAIPGVRYVLHPLREQTAERGFLRVAPLSALKPGVPFQAIVRDGRSDAYTRYPSGPIGGVWLVLRSGEGTSPSERTRLDSETPAVNAFQVVCPHLGCAVDYSSSRRRFACPCHASAFGLDGSRLSGPSPRDMDALACRVSDPDPGGQRWVEVRFERFRSGIVDKAALA